MRGWRYESFDEVLPFGFLVDEGTMLTKARESAPPAFFRTMKVKPKDFQFRPHEELQIACNILNQVSKYMREGWVVWTDFDKYVTDDVPCYIAPNAPPAAADFLRAHAQALGSIAVCDYYVTFCYTLPSTKGLASMLFTDGGKGKGKTKDQENKSFIESQLAYFNEVFNDVAGLFRLVYESVEFLDSPSLLSFLLSMYDERQRVAVPNPPAFLDVQMATKTCRTDKHLMLDDEYVVTLSINDFPSETRASMFAALANNPDTFRVSTRFVFADRETAKKRVDNARAQYNSKKQGAGGFITEQVLKQEDDLVDTEAVAMVNEASAALATFADSTVTFGAVTTTAVIRSRSKKNALALRDRLKDVFKQAEYMVKAEDIANDQAYLGTIPGNQQFHPRRYSVSSRNWIHFLPQTQPWEGHPVNDHLYDAFGYKAPHMIAKTGHRLFYYNRNRGMVGHGLCLGPSGAGKSIHLNAESVAWIGTYETGDVITFDVDASSKNACQNVGGNFFDLGATDGTGLLLNPFWDLQTPGNIAKIAELFFLYFESKGFPIAAPQETEIRESLEALATNNAKDRNFHTFAATLSSHNIAYRDLLRPFTDGTYKTLFHAGPDDFAGSRWTVFEMRKLMDMGEDIVRFCMNYIFFKLDKLFTGERPYLLNIDEGWIFLAHPTFSKKFLDWIRTLRKKHVYVNLATQNISELRKSSEFDAIASQCGHHVFLPNPQAIQLQSFYESLGLTYNEVIALQDDMRPQRDYLFHSAQKGTQMYNLCLDKARDPKQIQIQILTKPYKSA